MVFLECGYVVVCMDDIVLCSGLFKGGLYVYFVSKDEVFEVLLL